MSASLLGDFSRNSERTFEHVFPLLLEYACSALQILAPQEGCYRQSFGFRRAWLNGLLCLTLLLCLLLGSLLLLHLVLTHRLCFELLYVLLDSHAVLLRLGCELSLHLAQLVGRGLLARLRRHWWLIHGCVL